MIVNDTGKWEKKKDYKENVSNIVNSGYLTTMELKAS